MTRENEGVIIYTLLIFIISVAIGIYIGLRKSENKEAAEAQKNQEKTKIERRAENVINRIFYIRDKRTDLCFAATNVYVPGEGEYNTLTEVPCEKVQHLLPDNQK